VLQQQRDTGEASAAGVTTGVATAEPRSAQYGTSVLSPVLSSVATSYEAQVTTSVNPPSTPVTSVPSGRSESDGSSSVQRREPCPCGRVRSRLAPTPSVTIEPAKRRSFVSTAFRLKYLVKVVVGAAPVAGELLQAQP
jgi:hypothetical protein